MKKPGGSRESGSNVGAAGTAPRRRRIGFPAFLAAMLCMLVPALAGGEPAPGKVGIRVLHTSNVEGNLIPCPTCQYSKLGGLARRTAFIIGEKSRTGNVLVVDSGNLFSVPEGTRPTEAELRAADLLVEACGRMGMHAMNIGHRETAMGRDFFARPEVKKLPWISSNLLDGSGKPIFDPWIVRTMGNVRIGVIGLASPKGNAVVQQRWGEGAVIADPLLSAKKAIRQLLGQADVILLLSSLSPEEVDLLASENPGICFILGGGAGGTTVRPLQKSGTPVLRSGRNGMYVGRLDLTCIEGKPGFLDAGEEARLHLDLDGLEQRIAVMKKARENRGGPALEKMIAELEEKKKAIEGELVRVCSCSTETGKFLWSLVPMESDLPDDQVVLRRLEETGLGK
jgi:2',3'-cyclic-nucleotide 2'-phosphodiesterase (5'-nucleotidase family)